MYSPVPPLATSRNLAIHLVFEMQAVVSILQSSERGVAGVGVAVGGRDVMVGIRVGENGVLVGVGVSTGMTVLVGLWVGVHVLVGIGVYVG